MSATMKIVVTIVAAYLLAVGIGAILIPELRKLKAGQEIREEGPKWHKKKAGTPTMGGIAFILASLVCIVSGWPGMRSGNYTHLMVLALALCFGLIGFADDFVKVKKHRNLGLTALQKLLLQLVIAGVFLYALYRAGDLSCELWVPFTNWHPSIPPVVYILFAMFVIVGCVNAVNLTDGIDGLASGVTIPVMVFFAVTAYGMGKADLALFPAALAGALAGFLWFNFFPAKTFMGDTGSLFLGGAVCGMAFALDMPLILILVGLIYIVETVSVILQVGYFKLTHGKRLFRMSPIHHHLEMGGWSEYKIWGVFVGITCLMCVLAYFGVRGWFV